MKKYHLFSFLLLIISPGYVFATGAEPLYAAIFPFLIFPSIILSIMLFIKIEGLLKRVLASIIGFIVSIIVSLVLCLLFISFLGVPYGLLAKLAVLTIFIPPFVSFILYKEIKERVTNWTE